MNTNLSLTVSEIITLPGVRFNYPRYCYKQPVEDYLKVGSNSIYFSNKIIPSSWVPINHNRGVMMVDILHNDRVLTYIEIVQMLEQHGYRKQEPELRTISLYRLINSDVYGNTDAPSLKYRCFINGQYVDRAFVCGEVKGVTTELWFDDETPSIYVPDTVVFDSETMSAQITTADGTLARIIITREDVVTYPTLLEETNVVPPQTVSVAQLLTTMMRDKQVVNVLDSHSTVDGRRLTSDTYLVQCIADDHEFISFNLLHTTTVRVIVGTTKVFSIAKDSKQLTFTGHAGKLGDLAMIW